MHETTARVSVGHNEAAAAIGIGRVLLFRLLKSRTPPPSFFVGRRRLFPVAGLQEWAAERAAAAVADGDDNARPAD